MSQRPLRTNSNRFVGGRAARRGLTLWELLVVLTILVAVASIMIPMFPNFLRRAHKATDSTQTSEVAKAIQVYQASTYSYPDNLDSLITSANAYPATLPGVSSTAGAFGGFTTISTLADFEADALNNVGIFNLQYLASAPPNPTLNPYPSASISGDAFSVATGANVVVLNTTFIDSADGNPTFLAADRQRELAAFTAGKTTHAARYVVFGVGQRNSMIGSTIQDAPMSVPQDRNFTPDNTYCRVGVVFKISGYEVDKTERARFIGAVALEDDELESTEKDIVGYYNVAAAGTVSPSASSGSGSGTGGSGS